METRTLTLETADGPMALYEARPGGEARGAVVVIQEAFGVNGHIEDVTRRFAAEGYHAVAPAETKRALALLLDRLALASNEPKPPDEASAEGWKRLIHC